ncbi:hypothetical protein [Acinetobacter baumannii]|uniref:hypothetical protein n=1 Tax=Acinetobacter baumannii TaxID=470 RepID=UPI00044F6B35|nr:hypothetical protein [Acinetobacter baumannii]EXR46224.1 hypothetical protein J661_2853 [Acinetobacter baumannii 1391434]
MEVDDYTYLTNKKLYKKKARNKALPKATEKYLKAEEEFTEALDKLEIKYEKKFQFKSALLHKPISKGLFHNIIFK